MPEVWVCPDCGGTARRTSIFGSSLCIGCFPRMGSPISDSAKHWGFYYSKGQPGSGVTPPDVLARRQEQAAQDRADRAQERRDAAPAAEFGAVVQRRRGGKKAVAPPKEQAGLFDVPSNDDGDWSEI